MKRSAFTLIELLVVISIIAVLIGLLVPAVMKVRGKANDVQISSEITQLTGAAMSFKNLYGFYPPSRFALAERYSDYVVGGVPVDQLHADSLAALAQMFNRIKGANNWTTPRGFIDWNENGVADGQVILEGDQCLVFFLGGVMLNGNPIGFSPINSIDPSDTSEMAAPNRPVRLAFFNFKSSRLSNAVHGNGYPCYIDAYGTMPYAYFSNPYNRYGVSDCPTLGVWPYARQLGLTPVYINPSSCQIISAGQDKTFGSGSALPAGSCWPTVTQAGKDDRSNFSQYTLSVGGN